MPLNTATSVADPGADADDTPNVGGQRPADEHWLALIGNPNTGKTTLFNALTGGWARTGNYPGVTVDKRVGTLRDTDDVDVRVLDLPGTYSLAARSPDEMVAVDVLLGRRDDTPRPGAVIVVVDATNLERNLYLVTQVMELGLPTIVALNMNDTARRRGIAVDAATLATDLGVPVVSTVGHRGDGVPELRARALAALGSGAPPTPWIWPDAMVAAESRLAEALARLEVADIAPVERRRALLDVDGEFEHRLIRRAGEPGRQALREARGVLEAAGASAAGLESSVRYGYIGGIVGRSLERAIDPPATYSDRIDRVLTDRVVGTIVLVVVMTTMFMSIFAWATPLMDFIDGTLVGGLASWAEGWTFLGDGALRSLVLDGIIAGVGAVLVFVPQIVILFGFIALLEGCGYMSRAAFLMDRLMRRVGLSGRSFIPMLSSFACAIPGIMATRTIENRRNRIVTIFVAPFMSCSARIPVYVIMIAAFVPSTKVLGFLPLQGVVFVGMYLVGILVAIPTAFLLKRTVCRSDRPSFLVELPPYRPPNLMVVLRRMWESGQAFVVRAGTLIFAATILIWALSYFPRHPDPGATEAAAVAAYETTMAEERERLDVERHRQEQVVAAAEAQSPDTEMATVARGAYEHYLGWMAEQDAALEAKHAELEGAAARAAGAEALEYSALGRAGKFIEPVFEPMGWDWRVSVAVLASFPAREVFISSLGVIYQLGGDADAESEGLRQKMRASTWESGPKRGQPVFNFGNALALMVFFALCAQCVSTIVTIKKETGHWGWAVFSFVYMTALAWVGALVTVWIFGGGGAK